MLKIKVLDNPSYKNELIAASFLLTVVMFDVRVTQGPRGAVGPMGVPGPQGERVSLIQYKYNDR